MRNKVLTGILLAICSYTMVSCEKLRGEGPVIVQERQVSGYSRIENSVNGTCYVTQESNHRLTIEAQQNILEIIETPVIAGKLVIRFRKGKRIGTHDRIVVNVSAPMLEEISSEGSGDVFVTNDITSSNLTLRVSGSGELNAKHLYISNELRSSISGSGNMFALGGTAENAKYTISGSGGIDMGAVAVKNVDANISGSGSIRTNVSDHLDVDISGSGNVYYYGNPQISTRVSGSGNVRKMN